MGLLNRIFGAPTDRPEAAGSSDVTGEWEGHYNQHRDKRPIKAALTQEGNRILRVCWAQGPHAER